MKQLKVPKLKYKFLKKENDLNKVIKDQRKSGKKTYLLFVSLWDDLSSELVSKVTETYNDEEGKIPLYIIDSYNMPHSFVIYKTTKVPQLVILNKKNIYSDDYLSNIYNNLGLR